MVPGVVWWLLGRDGRHRQQTVYCGDQERANLVMIGLLLGLLPGLLGLLPGLLALNYTEEQRLSLLGLPADIRRTKVRTFGSEEMIAEDIRELLARTETSSGRSRWVYPSSSTQEMMELYRAEVSLTTRLRELRRQLGAAQLQLSLTEHRRTSHLLAAADLPPDKHFYEAGGLGIVQVTGLYQLNITQVSSYWSESVELLSSDWPGSLFCYSSLMP